MNFKKRQIKIIKLVIVFFFALASVKEVAAEKALSVYFSNDSVNGFKLSDAYETHSMGIHYLNGDKYYNVDFGLVTPNMYVYRNEFRTADRSFGEIVTLELGTVNSHRSQHEHYFRIKSAGRFGIDKMQDFAHKILNLQPVNSINKMVRMPNKTWLGIGYRGSLQPSLNWLGETKLQYEGYLGTDNTYGNLSLIKSFAAQNINYGVSVGVTGIVFDEIVSAPPINAHARSIIPDVQFGIEYETKDYKLFVKEKISLPTIASSHELFAVLSMGLKFKF